MLIQGYTRTATPIKGWQFSTSIEFGRVHRSAFLRITRDGRNNKWGCANVGDWLSGSNLNLLTAVSNPLRSLVPLVTYQSTASQVGRSAAGGKVRITSPLTILNPLVDFFHDGVLSISFALNHDRRVSLRRRRVHKMPL